MHVLSNNFVSFIYKGKLVLKIHNSEFKPIDTQGCQLGLCLIIYCGSRDERYNGVHRKVMQRLPVDNETFPQHTLVDHIIAVRSEIAQKWIIIGRKFQQQLYSGIDGD